MKKIAVLLAEGYEEGESLFLIDILRRGKLKCDSISISGDSVVTGGHGISVVADGVLDDSIMNYDMVVLPGGLPGAENLRNSSKVIETVRAFSRDSEKYVAAICAAPMVLSEAGISSGKKLTSYPADKYRDLFADAEYVDELVVIDGHLITGQGPAVTMEFAYTLLDVLGGNSAPLKEGMLYNKLLARS
ncbi:MAG: DJ-1/PfpI family protein [Spirochaetales bacterium]|nr:DJ-1/PfpI family protein [Spirochaetales bacterium]